jgi:hypothetical protein
MDGKICELYFKSFEQAADTADDIVADDFDDKSMDRSLACT